MLIHRELINLEGEVVGGRVGDGDGILNGRSAFDTHRDFNGGL